MKKIFFALGFLLGGICPIYAQVNEEIEMEETYPVKEIDMSSYTDSAVVTNDSTVCNKAEYDCQIEQMMHDFLILKSFNSDCAIIDDTTGHIFASEATYKKRLKKLPYEMEMPYNDDIKKFIEMYVKRKGLVSYMLGLGQSYYFNMFQQKLSAKNMPLELCYLPVMESALNTRALSRAGAAGLWQFMVGTGKMYGLEVNSLIDERRDPAKATDAAVRYLHDLYNKFGDWHVVIAAYNCGPGNIAKAMKRSGGKTSYWEIAPYLPRETQSYVPIFISACYIMNYYQEHGICPAKPKFNYVTDTVMVADRVHLQQIADVTGIDIEELEFLNPQYKKDILPGNEKAYPLTLPLSMINSYENNRDSILRYKPELSARMETAKSSYNSGSSSRGNAGGTKYYKVRKGDSLGKIAKKYGVTVNQLKKWNKLSSNTIQIGKTLKICR